MAKKILLAEDSITMQKIVQMTFAAEDFVITAVSSGEEAIQQAREAKPDSPARPRGFIDSRLQVADCRFRPPAREGFVGWA